LVEPENPEALAHGLREIWHDSNKRLELSEKAFNGVREHYSMEQMANKTVEVFETVIAGKMNDGRV